MKNRKVTAAFIAAAVLAGITFNGCGNTIDSEAVFATLDDTTITMGVANFYTKYQQATYDVFFMPSFGEDMWNQDLYGNGNTLQQDVKTEAAESLENMYLMKNHMADYNIEISKEEEDAMAKAADDFIAANSQAAIKQIGAQNREDVIEVLRLYTIQNKMHTAIKEEADAQVTDEEAAQRKISYVAIDTSAHYDEETSENVAYTDEEKTELKRKAQEIAGAEDFDTAVTDAGYTVSTDTYGSKDDTDASLNTDVLEAADKLKEGEISQVIETDNGYYVVRLDSEHDEEATAEKKENLISQKQEDHYQDVLSGWRDEAKWEINEEQWEKVVFEDLFKQPASTEDTEEAVTESTENISETEAE